MKQIQWFPGHIAKTLNEFKVLVKKIDIIIILLDARLPISSFLDSFNELLKSNKKLKVIIFFTKVDLVNQNELNLFTKKYQANKIIVKQLNLKQNQQKTKTYVLQSLDEIKIKAIIPKILILGIPNVGKSTLLNILTAKKSAVVQNYPGVTKKISWYNFNNHYWIMDTPGILPPKFLNEVEGSKLAAIGSVALNVLPLYTVGLNLYDLLIEKGIKVPAQYNLTTLQNDQVVRQFIIAFNTAKLGKIILD